MQPSSRMDAECQRLTAKMTANIALFASEPDRVVKRIWSKLIVDEGALLRRFLGRFRHVATVPNPSVIESVQEGGSDLVVHASTIRRLPFWPLWLPVLGVLVGHVDEAVRLAPEESAQIVETWLRLTPQDWPLRAQTAALGIAIARARVNDEHRGRRSTEAVDRAAWRATLSATREEPQAVRELSTILAGQGQSIRPPNVRGAKTHGHRSSRGRRASLPDEEFLRACLEGDGLYAAIGADPELASEILFKVLEPTEHIAVGILGDETGVPDFRGWFIPLYTPGAFSGISSSRTGRRVEPYRQAHQFLYGSLVLEKDQGPKERGSECDR